MPRDKLIMLIVLSLIFILFHLIVDSNAKEVPFLIKTLESPQDVEYINENFKSITLDLKRLEEKVMKQSATCELDIPKRVGTLCYDTSDNKLYVSTGINSGQFAIVGQQ